MSSCCEATEFLECDRSRPAAPRCHRQKESHPCPAHECPTARRADGARLVTAAVSVIIVVASGRYRPRRPDRGRDRGPARPGLAPGRAADRAVQRGARAVQAEPGDRPSSPRRSSRWAASSPRRQARVGAIAAQAYMGGQTDAIRRVLPSRITAAICRPAELPRRARPRHRPRQLQVRSRRPRRSTTCRRRRSTRW